MKKTLFLTTILALTFAACGTKNNTSVADNPPAATEAPLSFELLKDSLKDKNLTVTVELLVAKGKGSEAINEVINQKVCELLTMGDEKVKNLRNYKDMFAYLQKAFKESYPDGDLGGMMGWNFEFTMRNHYKSPTYLCLGFDSYSFAGGAHPSTYSGFINIDLASNKVLTNNELLDSAKIMPIIDAAFREHWKSELPKNAIYEEAGFFIEKNNLPLALNIGINESKVILCYNPYEIAAYAMGPTVLEIPLAQLAAGVKVK